MTISVRIQDAPSTPLNLRLATVYAPRVSAPPFVGFDAVEVGGGRFEVRGYDCDGNIATIYNGDLMGTYTRLAQHLRMDLEAVEKKK